MNPKAILAMLARKNVTLFACGLFGLWFAVHHPEQARALVQPIDDLLAPLLRDYGGGILGLAGFVYSIYLSTEKEKKDALEKLVNKYQDRPETVDPKDAKVLSKAGLAVPDNNPA